MSAALNGVGAGLSVLQALTGSRARLLPASFAGVPFYMSHGGGLGGRRLLTHEFPLRDTPYTEDLGRLPRRFRLTAYVVDDAYGSYLDYRDALIAACEAPGAATLVHPTFGALSCRAGVLTWSERIIELYGFCEFQLDFIVDGPQPSPLFSSDTASALLGGVATLLPIITAAYTTVQMALVSPQLLLTNAVSAMLGLPPSTILGLSAQIAAVSATPANQTATAAAVQTVTQAMAATVIAGATAPVTSDPVAGTPFGIAGQADASGGLATLAAWGSTLPAVSTGTAIGIAQAAVQAAVTALVQGCATAAVVQVYASIDWPYANAAQAALTQVVSLIDAQALSAANAGADALYLAWQGIEQLAVANLVAEAQSLPSLGSYVTADALPSLALAQALFQDASRAGQLEDINDVPHPLFMPAAGLCLVAA